MGGPIQLQSVIFCDLYVVDVNGKHSYIGAFDRIISASFDAVLESVYIICFLNGEPDTSTTSHVEIWTPSEMLLLQTQASTVQFGSAGKAVLAIRVKDLQFECPGTYTLVVGADGRPVGNFEFDVYKA